tara:strand:+ start:358 stop:1188 length:831 start_codon:yes stop_codon:yes gene_type:complete
MAKKATAKKVEVAPQELTTPQIVVENPKAIKPSWEIKDRTYILIGNDSPLTHTMPSRHSRRYPLLWFDKEKGEQKELRYATNHNSPFVQEQKGEATLGHIVFRDGVLNVEKEKQNLQKLLSLYHPLIGKKFIEFDSSQEAVEELDDIEIQIDALNAAREMEIEQAEAIVRVEQGTKVSSMKSSEIKRDLMVMAKQNPSLFISLANDENVGLRNIAIKAVEVGIIKLSQDQRSFHWGSNNRKLMTVPFDENPYSAMAAYFKTDEGVEVYRSVEKMIK